MIYRNFKRFKSTFFINLIGLSSGMACTLLIYLWVSDELGMDKFHENGQRLYQVLTNQHQTKSIVTLGDGPGLLGEALEQEMSEIEYAVSSSAIDKEFILSASDLHVRAAGLFGSKDFFKMFSYPLVEGDKNKVLLDKNSIVISEAKARAIFNTNDIVGKTIEVQTAEGKALAQISGVFKNIPSNSSMQFDFVLSYEAFKEIIGKDLTWGNHHALNYVLLQENANVDQFNIRIKDFIKTKSKESNITLFAQPFVETYLYGSYENGAPVGGRIEYVRLFSIIAIFILIIACINFMNLSTAKATHKLKEIGIKKAIGAARRTLMQQYLTESLALSFFSLLIAILIVDLFLPSFNSLTGKQLTLIFNAKFNLSIFSIAAITGILAGSYPAIYLSSFNTASVLKGKLTGSLGEIWARKGLVAFQFTLSVIFIVSVLVVYKQIEFVQSKNLGYDKDNVFYFSMEGKISENKEAFLSEIKNVPNVINASSMWGSIVGRTGFTTGFFDWEGRNQDEIIQFEHLGIDYDLLEVLGIEMASGRSFSRDFPSDSSKIILNEEAIAVMGLKDPVGKIFNLWGNNMEIIGLTKNFHFQSLHENVKPFFFRLQPKKTSSIMVKVKGGQEKETVNNIRSVYEKFNPGYSFDYKFLDQDYQAQYEAEMRVAKLSRYFAGLAILISCLGLFGLAAFTAERRLKEIGIRKVLGSSVFGIVSLLSADFTKIVLVSILTALPISYLITKQWLDGFAFKISLEWWYFIGAGVIALIISWITVFTQTFKAARVNPVKCLNNE
jgi:putative ABC transport system permease protein